MFRCVWLLIRDCLAHVTDIVIYEVCTLWLCLVVGNFIFLLYTAVVTGKSALTVHVFVLESSGVASIRAEFFWVTFRSSLPIVALTHFFVAFCVTRWRFVCVDEIVDGPSPGQFCIVGWWQCCWWWVLGNSNGQEGSGSGSVTSSNVTNIWPRSHKFGLVIMIIFV